MKKQDKEQWMREVMDSLDSLKRPDMPAGTLAAIEKKARMSRIVNMPMMSWRRVAAAAAILFILASADYFMLSRGGENHTSQNSMAGLASYYQLTDNNPLYGL